MHNRSETSQLVDKATVSPTAQARRIIDPLAGAGSFALEAIRVVSEIENTTVRSVAFLFIKENQE